MQITMLETRRGTENDFTVRRLYEGETHEVMETLGRTFIADEKRGRSGMQGYIRMSPFLHIEHS